mgnify:CR=1 FL=1
MKENFLIKPINLFSFTFISIISIYLFVLGEDKTIEIIKNQYLFILSLVPLIGIYLYFRVKLKDCEIINFNKNTNLSFKTTVILFMILLLGLLSIYDTLNLFYRLKFLKHYNLILNIGK